MTNQKSYYSKIVGILAKNFYFVWKLVIFPTNSNIFSDRRWGSTILDQCLGDQDPGQGVEPVPAQGQPQLHPERGVGHLGAARQPAGQWQGYWREDG